MTVRILLPSPNAGRLAQQFLLAVGILAVGYAAYTEVARYAYQAYENWAFDRSLAQPRPAQSLVPRGSVKMKQLIGRIAIPRLGISAVVNEGIDYRTLGRAVGHIPSTPLPGQPGNVGVAAHRDTLFRKLRNIRRNDEITFATLDGQYVYRVVSFKIVMPSEVSVLASSANEQILTLVTCYPFYFVGDAPKRFVVRARQISN